MANQFRSEAKARLWRERVSAWQQSGLAVRQYWRRQQLSEPSFYAWRRELARRDAAAGGPVVARGGEVPGVSAPSHAATASAARRPRTPPARSASLGWLPVTVTAAAVVEVELPGGTVLRVPAGVERQTLQHLLAALRQTSAEPASAGAAFVDPVVRP